MKHLLLLLFVWVTFWGEAAAQFNNCNQIERDVNYTTSNVKCRGGSDGTAKAPFISGATYLWTKLNDPEFIIVNPGNFEISGLTAGTYRVNIRSGSNDCFKNVVISEPSTLLTISVSTTNPPKNVTCAGESNGTINVVSGGGSAGTKTFSINVAGVPTNTTGSFSNLPAGTYTVSVADAGGCIQSIPVTITQPTAVALSSPVITSVSCADGLDGSIQVSASGGTPTYTYTLVSQNVTPAISRSNNTGSFSSMPKGSYTLTAFDRENCPASQTVVVGGPNPITLTSTQITNVTCNGYENGSITAVASGGTGSFNYSLRLPNNTVVSNGTSNNFNGLAAGNYVILVSDQAAPCTREFPVLITEPALLAVSLGANSLVVGCGTSTGSATAVPSGGTGPYTYSWNTNPVQNTAQATGLGAGQYTVTVTDAKGCTSDLDVTVTQSTSGLNGTVSNIIPVSCFGASTGSVNVAGVFGDGVQRPITYTLSPAVPGSYNNISNRFENLPAGNYTVTFSSPNFCSDVEAFTISQPDPLDVSVVSFTNACGGLNNGSVTVTGAGGTPGAGYQYKIGNGAYGSVTPFGFNFTFNNLSAGSHTVVIRDECGVEKNLQVTVGGSASPLVIGFTKKDACFQLNTGSVTLTGQNGTAPYAFSFNGGTFSSVSTFTGLTAGSYPVAVRDALGCVVTSSVTIAQPAVAIAIGFSNLVSETCIGAANGRATATASNGVAPYTYVWNSNPVKTGATVTGLTAGTYTVTATDANGCSNTGTVTIMTTPDNTPPVINQTSMSLGLTATCGPALMPDLKSRATDNCGGITFIQSIDIGNSLVAGTYNVTVSATDAAGNTTNGNITVTVADITPPVIECPPSQQLYATGGERSAQGTYGLPTATDICSPNITIEEPAGLSSGAEFPIGINTISYRVSDGVGNTSTCSFKITVGGSYCNPDPSVQNNPNFYKTTNSNGYWGDAGSWVNGIKPPWDIVYYDPYNFLSYHQNGAIIIPPGAVVFINGQTDLKVMVNGVPTYPNLIVYGTLVVDGAFVIEENRYLDVMSSGFVTSCTFSNSAKLGYRPQQGDKLAGIGNFQSWRGGQNSPLTGYCRIVKGWEEVPGYVCGQMPPPLPVTLLSFNSSIIGNKIFLDWSTASEKNFDFFTVERSADVENFDGIGNVKGAGNSTELNKYKFTDHTPLQGKSYYRLKATDFDGTVEYHKIIMVEYGGKAAMISIYPNPTDGTTFTLKTSLKADAKNKIIVYNMLGAEIYQSGFNPGETEFNLTRKLEAGVYLVIVSNATEKHQIRLVVK